MIDCWMDGIAYYTMTLLFKAQVNVNKRVLLVKFQIRYQKVPHASAVDASQKFIKPPDSSLDHQIIKSVVRHTTGNIT